MRYSADGKTPAVKATNLNSVMEEGKKGKVLFHFVCYLYYFICMYVSTRNQNSVYYLNIHSWSFCECVHVIQTSKKKKKKKWFHKVTNSYNPQVLSINC